MVPNGRSVTESLYLISPNNCFCIHSAGASANSAENCLLKAEREISQADASSFTVLQLFVIVQDLIFEVLRTAYNHIEKIRKFLSGIVKANVPEKFLEFLFRENGYSSLHLPDNTPVVQEICITDP